MSKIGHAIREIDRIEELSARDQWMNQIHPLVKLLITVSYIAVTVSFSKYDLFGLIGMIFYVVICFSAADLSLRQCLKRIRIVLPLVCLIGIVNPVLDHNIITFGDVEIRAGVISMVTLMIKGVLTVFAGYILIATTSIEKICYALRMLHVPSIMVTQLMLTYRYLSLLLGEVERITQAYSLRAPNQKGVHFKVWGSLTGQLLLRSIDRANDVYESMMLRGYTGEFHYLKHTVQIKRADIVYLICWLCYLILFRKLPVVLLIGMLLRG